MNRDEHEARKENMTGVEQIALGALPAEIMGAEAPTYVLDLQAAVNKAVSRTTRNSRLWSHEILRSAFKAARPVVEKYLRQQGKAFTKSDVRTTVRKSVAAYTSQYGVVLPGSMVLGKTDLEAVAGDICGAFDMPWMAFMPPQVILAKQAADAGKPRAKSWLKRLFGIKDKPAVTAAPAAAPTPVAAATPAAAPATALATTALAEKTVATSSSGRFVGSSDSLGVAEILGSSDSLGAWLHSLNPFYWLKSKEERDLIDKEKQAWIDNAKLQKQLGKKEEVLQSAEKALAAKQAVEAAKARSAEMEAQLKSIESQVLGSCMGCSKEQFVGEQFVGAQFVGDKFVGADKSDTGAQFVGAQFVGTDKSDSGAQFVGAQFVGAAKDNPFSEEIPAMDAAPTLKKIATARKLNEANKAELDTICAKIQANVPLSPDEVSKTLILLARNEQLHEFRKALVAGDIYASNPSAKKLQRQVTLGAMKALTPSEQQMVSHMITLAKQNNPNAKKALQALQDQGYAVTMGYDRVRATVVGKALTPAEQSQLTRMIELAKQGNPNAQKALQTLQAQGVDITSSMGFGISDAFKIATAPIWLPAKLISKGYDKAFGKGGGPASPEQLRLQRLQAAQKRRQAAAARARAADAQTQAEYRTQQSLAAAADAEADAADAEANAKEAAMISAEQQYAPAETPEYDQSGASRPIITPLPPTPVPSPTVTVFAKDVRKRMAKKTPEAHKILIKSEENSPTGMKLKASMELYRKAKANKKSPEYKAAATIIKKAKKGDKQAQADAHALKVASIAVKAEKNAQKHVVLVYKYRAANAKGIAVRKRAEVAMSEQLIRQSRAAKLRKVAKIERLAAAGSPKHVAFVKAHVAKAKAGDKKSQEVVAALQLVKHVRQAAPTRREKRNVALAQRMAHKVGRGNKKAILQSRLIAAAAKGGNPNAIRAKKRLQTGAALEMTLATGMVVLPAVVITSEIAKKREQAKKQQVAKVETKVAKGTASREEVQAAAKSAADLGDKDKARELATTAATLPSATESLKQTAAVAAAAVAGSPAHIAAMNKAEAQAAAGDPAGVEAMGKVAAVQALNQVTKGKPLAPEMKTAVQDLEAAQDGNAAAQEKLATMEKQAEAKDPVAIKYMVAATGAAVVAKSLAANPVALEEWHKKAGVVPETSETEDTQVVTAEVMPVGHPFLPDEPLHPIQDVKGLIKASLRALTLATRDPFANWRAGHAARGTRALSAVTSSGAAYAPAIAAAATGIVTAAATSAVKDQMTASAKQGAGAGLKAVKRGKGKPAKGAGTPGEDDREEVDENDYMVHGDDAKIETIQVKQGSKLAQLIHEYREKNIQHDKDLPTDKKVSSSLLGSDVHPDHQKHVEPTKNKLGAIKTAADKGDKDAQKKWSVVLTNFKNAKTKADKGDEKAKQLVAVLEATSLFAK